MAESTPLLPSPLDASAAGETVTAQESYPFHKRLASRLESHKWHWAVIFLTALDALFVVVDISFDFLKDPKCICTQTCPEDPPVLEVFHYLSICITALFLLEVPLALYAFGGRYYTTAEHAWLHVFDAVVISSTFVLEVFLAGREAEIAGLLVLLRLWRVVKLVSTVSVGVTEYNDVEVGPRVSERMVWQKEKVALQERIKQLTAELADTRNSMDSN